MLMKDYVPLLAMSEYTELGCIYTHIYSEYVYITT